MQGLAQRQIRISRLVPGADSATGIDAEALRDRGIDEGRAAVRLCTLQSFKRNLLTFGPSRILVTCRAGDCCTRAFHTSKIFW